MWRWAAVWLLSFVLFTSGTIDFGIFTRKRHYVPAAQVDCFDVSTLASHRFGRSFNDGKNNGWHPRKPPANILMTSTTVYPTNPILNTNEILSRRIDYLLPAGKEIVKEHAKLVQDINSLKQVVFISPLIDENRDYDDSIFHEMIETSTTARPIPQTAKPVRTSSIPIILLGGESQKEVIKSQPVKYVKPISLVGTSISPLVKHPYPFVMQAKSPRPFKFCMQPMPLMYTTTQRPSLLQRIINSLIPRGR